MTEAQVRKLIERDDWELCKAIVLVYQKQTRDERESRSTRNWNGVGFNRYDAPFLTSLAEQIIRNKRQGRLYLLSRKQTAAGRKAIMKYAGQIARIINEYA